MDKPLREVLQGAIESRNAALRAGRSHRNDEGYLRACVATCENIVRSYHSDEAIRRLCRKYEIAVRYVVPGNQPEVLKALLGETKNA